MNRFPCKVQRRITRWRLSGRMQRRKERHRRGDFSRIQVFPERGHIAAALDDLPHELIPGEAKGHLIERRSALASLAVERMAVAALLRLEDEGASPLQRRTPVEIFLRDRHAAPRVHHRAPRCVQA